MLELDTTSSESSGVREKIADSIAGRMLRLTFPAVEGTFSCSWKWNPKLEPSQQWVSLELFISREHPWEDSAEKIFPITDAIDEGDTARLAALQNFFHKAVGELDAVAPGDLVAITFILPAVNGYIMQSDVIDHRIVGCELVSLSCSFVKPLGHIKSFEVADDSHTSVLEAIAGAVGALLVPLTDSEDKILTMAMLQRDLSDRLSFQWISPTPIERKRLLWVEGRASPDLGARIYEAAHALGVDIVVLDRPGHWLHSDHSPYAHWREAFIPITKKVDEKFPQFIIESVKSYPHKFDGVTTIADGLVAGVASVAEHFGFHTSPSASLARASDKFQTRAAEVNPGFYLYVSSVEQLNEYLEKPEAKNIPYPLIVKPTLGWKSDCVTKVNNEKELIEATKRASSRNTSTTMFSDTGVLIEEYITGPEVDANLILWNGEIISSEICDDFPGAGDKPDSGPEAHFADTAMMYPSRLPANELKLIEKSMHRSLLNLGLKHGIFHCEARVRNSSMAYSYGPDGSLDLRSRPEGYTAEPSVYLHEINPRTPGWHCTSAIDLTYGVNYYAIQILLAIGDEKRARALSQHFTLGPQYVCQTTCIQPDRGGILVSRDPAEALAESRPDLKSNIILSKTWTKTGSKIPDPKSGNLVDIAVFCIASRARKGREDVLRLEKEVRKSLKIEIVDE